MRNQASTITSLGLGLLIAGCAGSQPPTASATANTISSDSAITSILERSCFQCHSNTGSAPWYAAMSPTYLMANSARGALNFSDWQTYDADKRAAELKSIEQAVSAGWMPPGDYTALDHSARLSEDRKQILLKWTDQPAH